MMMMLPMPNWLTNKHTGDGRRVIIVWNILIDENVKIAKPRTKWVLQGNLQEKIDDFLELSKSASPSNSPSPLYMKGSVQRDIKM